MILLGILTSGLWFGVGVFVAWKRSKRAYQVELFDANSETAKRKALWRAVTVFYGWTVAGLVGVILWVILYLYLIVGRAELEERSRPSSRRESSGSLLSILLLGAAVMITEEALHAAQENADKFAIKFAVFITLVGCLVAFIAISPG